MKTFTYPVWIPLLFLFLFCPVDSAEGQDRTFRFDYSDLNKGRMTVDCSFSERQLTFQVHKEDTWVSLEEGCRPEDKPGTPWLPARFIQLLIPAKAEVVSLEATGEEKLIRENILLPPVQPPFPLSSKEKPTPVAKDPVAYAADTRTPTELVEFAGAHTMRGYRIVSIRLNPVRYIPAARELYLATRITLDLNLRESSEQVVIPRVNQEITERSVANLVVNKDVLRSHPAFAPKWKPRGGGKSPLTNYLIITSPGLASSFQDLADYRQAQMAPGETTKVITTAEIYSSYSGKDNQEQIQNCIRDYYHNEALFWVVLGGDDTIVPDRDCYGLVETSSGPEICYDIPTDLYYAGLDSYWDENGDGIHGKVNIFPPHIFEGDLLPEVIVGRIPVRTSAAALDYINKLIAFEEFPRQSDMKMFIGGAHLWDSYTGGNRPTDSTNDGHLGFQQHDPVSDAEMWSRRMYRDYIQDEPWPQIPLVYFFDTLTSWDSSTPGDYPQTSGNMLTRLNEGWENVFIGSHGGTDGWGLEVGSFTSIDASALTNRTDMVYTMACCTGEFDSGIDPCLSEAFLRNGNGGALAYMGCSRFGWGIRDEPPAETGSIGGTSYEYARGFYRIMFYGGSHIGTTFSAHKEDMVPYCGANNSYRWVQFGMNLQGDPMTASAQGLIKWVDAAHSGPESGTYTEPYATLFDGVQYSVDGHMIYAKEGVSDETCTIDMDKEVTIHAHGGDAVFGKQ